MNDEIDKALANLKNDLITGASPLMISIMLEGIKALILKCEDRAWAAARDGSLLYVSDEPGTEDYMAVKFKYNSPIEWREKRKE